MQGRHDVIFVGAVVLDVEDHMESGAGPAGDDIEESVDAHPQGSAIGENWNTAVAAAAAAARRGPTATARNLCSLIVMFSLVSYSVLPDCASLLSLVLCPCLTVI